VELAFACLGEKPYFVQSAEYFLDLAFMGSKVVGIDQDIVKIDDNAYIDHVGKSVVHEPLEGGWRVGKSLWNYQPFKGAVASAERGLVLIAFRYAN